MSRRGKIVLAWCLSIALIGAMSFIAGRATLAVPEKLPETTPTAKYTVVTETLGRETTFETQIEWTTRTVAFALGEGTVTSVNADLGLDVKSGDTLFHIDLQPVFVGQGEVPSFRDLSQGDKGVDVTQLQSFLKHLGFFVGTPDGNFGSKTLRAVRQWQKSVDLPVTGIVRANDIVYVPSLSERIQLGADIVVGKRPASGVPIVDVVSPTPRMTISVDSKSKVPVLGTPVQVEFGEKSWPGVISAGPDTETDQSGTVLSILKADGTAVCGEECAVLLGAQDSESVWAKVEMIPKTTGPIVPIGALSQDELGGYFVTLIDGSEAPIEVVITDGSRVVVSGIEEGTELLIMNSNESGKTDSEPSQEDKS